MGDNRRLLFLTPESPYPAVGGGALRTASLLEFLRTRFLVDVVAFREGASQSPTDRLPPGKWGDTLTITLPAHKKDTVSRAVRNAGRLLRGVPPLLDRFSGFEGELGRWLKGRSYDVSVIEHFWCAPYLRTLRPHCGRVLLDLHNIESELHSRCADAEFGILAHLHRRFSGYYRELESEWLPQFDTLLVTSKEDGARATSFAPNAAVCVYPNAIPWREEPEEAAEEVIAFSGNLEFLPNQEAVKFFYERVWPLLKAMRPKLRWRLIGMNPEAVGSVVAGDQSIELTGWVEDAVVELARARVAVVPLLAGSGTRVKILEAWAAGVPVVSTPIGAEGLKARDGVDLLLAEMPEDFANRINDLLGDSEQRRLIGECGRARYEADYTWPAAWKSLAGLGL